MKMNRLTAGALFFICSCTSGPHVITTDMDDRIRIVRHEVLEHPDIVEIMASQPEDLQKLGMYIGVEPPDSITVGLGQKSHIDYKPHGPLVPRTIDGSSVTPEQIDKIAAIVGESACNNGFHGFVNVVQVDAAGNTPVVLKKRIR